MYSFKLERKLKCKKASSVCNKQAWMITFSHKRLISSDNLAVQFKKISFSISYLHHGLTFLPSFLGLEMRCRQSLNPAPPTNPNMNTSASTNVPYKSEAFLAGGEATRESGPGSQLAGESAYLWVRFWGCWKTQGTGHPTGGSQRRTPGGLPWLEARPQHPGLELTWGPSEGSWESYKALQKGLNPIQVH